MAGLLPSRAMLRRGPARDLALGRWLERRSYAAERYDAGQLAELKRETVSVVLPSRNVAATIGPVLDALAPLEAIGLLDEIVVVDGDSRDGTREIAAGRGATVHQEDLLMPEHGPACGKGDAMWRGVAATSGDIVVFLDTDTEDFTGRFVLGLLGPLFEDSELQFVKGAFRRPFRIGEELLPDGGGRVTELVARPLLNLYVPELCGFAQPLAGEVAARRPLLERLPFPVGYGVETAMLIDAVRLVGIDALAQVDLGTRQNRHQPLRDLSAMAYAVLVTATLRIHGEAAVESLEPGLLAVPDGRGFDLRSVTLGERPPLADLRQTEQVAARA